MGELVTVVLPDLARRAALDVRSDRLPPVVRNLAPRIVLQLDQTATGLSVLPALVYGSPPVARIDAGKLVYLRGPVPLRDVPAEGRAVERLRAELDLLPGRRTSYDGADAPRFVAKLGRWRGDLAGDAAGIVKPAATLEPRLRVITEGEPGQRIGALRADFHRRRRPARGAAARARRPPGRSTPRRSCAPGRRGSASSRSAKATGRRCRIGWLEKHGQRVADLLAAREDDGRLARHSLPALAALCVELEHPPPPGLDRLAPLAEGFERLPEAPLPRDLDGDAARVSAPGRRAGSPSCAAPAWAACSPTTWASARPCRRCARSSGPTLVVCPTSVVLQLAGGAARASGPASRCRVYHGPARALDATADVTLTSYALLRLDAKALSARALERGGPRRGAGDQEPRQPGRARRVRAAARASAWR